MRVIVVAVLLVLAGAGLATQLSVSASTGSLVGGGNDSGRATEVARERFGDDAVYVLVRGDLPQMVLTSDLNRLLGLEGCLSGNVPEGVEPPGGAGSPCDRIAAADRVHVVYGPGTFINSSVNELTAQLQGRTRERAAQAEQVRAAAEKQARAAGQSKAKARGVRQGGGEGRLPAVRVRAARDERQVRAEPDGRAEAQRPGLRLPARVRRGPRRADPEGAVRLPVPVGRQRADLRPAQARVER